MTQFQNLLAAIEARGKAAARAATGRAGDRLAAAAARDLPGLNVMRDGDDLVLSAPRLGARAFGSRRALPDPRLTGFVAGARL